MTDIGLMVRSANPIPDETQALTDDELSAVLLLAQQRSGGMDTKQAPPVVAPEKNSRSGWLVAAATFALVLFIVGASLLIANNGETPPATTPPTTEAVTPTTEAAPTTIPDEEATPTTEAVPTTPTAEQIAAISALVDARNAYDFDQLRGLLAADAVVGHPQTLQGFSANHTPGSGAFNYDWMSDMIDFEAALNAEWTIDSCALLESGRIRCDLTYTDDMVRVFGNPWKWELQTSGAPGAISVYVMRHADGPRATEEWAELLTWINGISPEDADVAGRITENPIFRTPDWNGEAGAMVASYLEAFADAKGSA